MNRLINSGLTTESENLSPPRTGGKIGQYMLKMVTRDLGQLINRAKRSRMDANASVSPVGHVVRRENVSTQTDAIGRRDAQTQSDTIIIEEDDFEEYDLESVSDISPEVITIYDEDSNGNWTWKSNQENVPPRIRLPSSEEIYNTGDVSGGFNSASANRNNFRCDSSDLVLPPLIPMTPSTSFHFEPVKRKFPPTNRTEPIGWKRIRGEEVLDAELATVMTTGSVSAPIATDDVVVGSETRENGSMENEEIENGANLPITPKKPLKKPADGSQKKKKKANTNGDGNKRRRYARDAKAIAVIKIHDLVEEERASRW